ncbi:MAG: hypothetical protein JW862_07100 [Anaerolineales bacterium]|nr:hypothetical protein [Anaerolineales bacterium]
MMNKKVSNRDWINLSAYLDGQLPTRQAARIEARLKAEPELQQAYRGLLRNRQALRDLPRLRAPRNFTLTPQMVKVPQQMVFRWPRALAMTSALASLLLVLVVVSDLFVLRGGNGAQLAAQPVAFEAEMLADQAGETEMPAIREAPQADSMTLEEPVEVLPGATAPYPSPEMMVVQELTVESEAGATLQPQADSEENIMLAAPDEQTVAPGETSADLPAAGETTVLEETPKPRLAGQGASPVAVWVELALGLLVLASALGAFYLNRRGS